MGTSYAKAANRPDLRELFMDPANPWEYAEESSQAIVQSFVNHRERLERIEEELMTLQKNKPNALTQPQVSKKHQVKVANASIHIEEQNAAEKVKIEIKERRWIRCSSLKKKIFYTKLYFVKKTDREEMEVEGERTKKTHKCHKISVIKTKTRWNKTYVKKEMMAIEKI